MRKKGTHNRAMQIAKRKARDIRQFWVGVYKETFDPPTHRRGQQ